MKPQRELLPAGPAAPSSASSERESTPQSATGTSAPRRRPQTKIACTSCRRRKSKCDGQRPVCSLCAGMGRTMCEYDAGPDVTRFAALKSKHEELQRRLALFEELFRLLSMRSEAESIELQRRLALFEELFRLLSMRSEAESIEIIRRMRTANMETDLDDLVKFIKNADLLIQLASTQSKQATPVPGATDAAAMVQLPMDELSSLLELLKSAVSKLDAPTRGAFLGTIRHHIDTIASSQRTHFGGDEMAVSEAMMDGESNEDVDGVTDGVPESRPGGFLKGLLNDDDDDPAVPN